MLLVIESVVLCLIFTILVYILSREPIKTLYNYPYNIQQRVQSLEEYKDKIPTKKNKIFAKLGACIIFAVVIALLMKYVNACTSFKEAFIDSYILWTIVNLYDAVVMDIIWFCHDPYFVFKGTEDMIDDYHDYFFHFKGFLIGELIAIVVCIISGLIVEFIL